MAKKIFCEWSTIEDLTLDLSGKIPKDIKFIHGLSRGGLIPAVILSHITGIPMINSPLSFGKWQVLIVDDICDSGETLKKWKGYTTAVLHHKPHTSCFTPTIYASLHKEDTWIIYPWEREDSKTIQDYKL